MNRKILAVILLAGCAGENTKIDQEIEVIMSRDASGNYTLPAGNPVVSGSLIETSWANPTMSDIGNELSDSLSRSGKGGMTAPLKHTDGTAATPSITFLDQLSIGLYRATANDLRVSVGSTDSMRWTLAGVQTWDGSQWNNLLTSSNAIIDGPNPTLADASAALITGTADPVNDPHIAYGLSAIQAKSNENVAANLSINELGGNVDIGPGSGIGSVSLFDDGTRVVETISGGFVSGNSGSLNLTHIDNTISAFNGLAPEEIQINDNGGDVRLGDPGDENIIISGKSISAEDNGSGTTLQLNPAGGTAAGVSLFWQGTKQAETANPAAGGFFINNGLTGTGTERALTASDRFSGVILLTANIQLSSSYVGKYIVRDGPGNLTMVLPQNIATISDQFAEIVIDNLDDQDTGTITISPSGTSVRVNSGDDLVIQAGSTAYLKQISPNVWRLYK